MLRKALDETIVSLKAELALKDKVINELRANMDRLTHQLNELLRNHFGQKSEKHLSLDEPDVQPDADLEDLKELEFDTIIYQRKKRQGRRVRLSDEYPRLRIEYALPDPQLLCDCGCGQKLKKIGEVVTEQLAIVPKKLYVKQHVRFKYGDCPYDSKIITAPMLLQPIKKGLASPEIIAYTALNKYADHLPLYRQEVRYARYGLDISRQTQCDWLREGAKLYRELLTRIKTFLLSTSPIVNTDDTPIAVQEKGKGKTKTGRLWVYASHGDNVIPYAIYEYTENRSHEGPKQFFGDYKGYIQADAYSGYDCLFHKDNEQTTDKPTEVGCWMHSRRKFYAIAKQTKKKGLAYDAVQFIRKLYGIEKRAKEQNVTSQQRYELRQKEAIPILTEFKIWLDKLEQQVLPKSPLGEAMTYALNQWQALIRYTENGMLEIDNGYAERLLKPPTIGKKNYMFFGNDNGGKTAAAFYTLIQCATLNGLNEFEYMTDITMRLASRLYRHIDELLPHLWKPLNLDYSQPIIVDDLIHNILSSSN